MKIAGNYNKKYKNKIAIPANKDKLTEQDRGHLWKSIKEKLKDESPCEEDFCYLETDIVKELNMLIVEYKQKYNNDEDSWARFYNMPIKNLAIRRNLNIHFG